MLYLLNRNGATIGAAETDHGAAALANRIGHGFGPISSEAVDEIDCHDVSGILAAIAAREEITMTAEFVPFSISRSAGDVETGPGGKPTARIRYSLNWRVTLARRGREVLVTDYSQGMGQAPSAKHRGRKYGATAYDKKLHREAEAYEAETGRVARFSESIRGFWGSKAIPGPAIGDVLSALARDCDVLDAGGFASWAADLGFDPDSRKAESIYRACIEIATKLRAGLGADVLAELQLVARFN